MSSDGKYLLTCAMLYIPPSISLCPPQYSEDRYKASFSPISHTERLDTDEFHSSNYCKTSYSITSTSNNGRNTNSNANCGSSSSGSSTNNGVLEEKEKEKPMTRNSHSLTSLQLPLPVQYAGTTSSPRSLGHSSSNASVSNTSNSNRSNVPLRRSNSLQAPGGPVRRTLSLNSNVNNTNIFTNYNTEDENGGNSAQNLMLGVANEESEEQGSLLRGSAGQFPQIPPPQLMLSRSNSSDAIELGGRPVRSRTQLQPNNNYNASYSSPDRFRSYNQTAFAVSGDMYQGSQTQFSQYYNSLSTEEVRHIVVYSSKINSKLYNCHHLNVKYPTSCISCMIIMQGIIIIVMITIIKMIVKIIYIIINDNFHRYTDLSTFGSLIPPPRWCPLPADTALLPRRPLPLPGSRHHPPPPPPRWLSAACPSE